MLCCAKPVAWLCLAVAATAAGAERPPVENLVNVSWGDQIMIARGDAQLDEPDKIRRAMRNWLAGFDGRTILWRGSSQYIARFYNRRAQSSPFITAYYKKVADVSARFDALGLARRVARENGQRFLIYMTVFDHGAPTSELYGGNTPFPWQDRFTIEHPEVQAVDRKGVFHYGVLEMAHPEARRLMVERIKGFVDEFDTDGVYVCPRTHSLPALHADQFGFGKPVADEFRRRHGVDIRTDPRFDCTAPGFDPKHELVEKWRRLRGEYVVQFHRELRQALPGKTIYAGVPRGRYAGPPYGNRYLDWESLVREKLVDGLVIRVYSGKGLHPPLYVAHAKIGYLSSEDDRINVPSMTDAAAKVYGPLCRRHGVKLFCNTGSYGGRHKRWRDREPALSGFMINTPSGGAQVVVGHDDALCGAGGPLTVEALVRVNRLPKGHEGWPRILSKYDHLDSPANRGWEWLILPNGRFRFRVNQQAPGDAGMGADVTVDSPERMPVGRWVHVATVYDLAKRELRLYLDGREAARRDMPARPMRVNAEQDLFLGRYGGADSHRFDGLLDELRITAAALVFTAAPAAPYTGREPNTVALFHFDKVTDTSTLADSTPAAAHPARIRLPDATMLAPSRPGSGQALRLAPAGR